MMLTKDEIDMLYSALRNHGELKVQDLDTTPEISSLLAIGFIDLVSTPVTKRTWYVYTITKKGVDFLIEWEKENNPDQNGTKLSREELKKKMNTGELTIQEFEEYSNGIFGILKENKFEAKIIPGSEYVIFKDAQGGFIKNDPNKTEFLIDSMSKYAAGVMSIDEFHKKLFEIGMCFELCRMFITLMHDSMKFKDLLERMEKTMHDVETQVSDIDKLKFN